MPTRRITYADQLAVSLFAMQDAKQRMLDAGFLAQAILGNTTQLDGFACTPTSPPNLTVNVAGGTIFKYQNVDDTAFGALPSQIPADTTHQVVKYATILGSTPFTITPPATTGFSRNDLIQINFQEADGDSENIPFWNGTNVNGVPNPPLFLTENVLRIDSVIISVVTGVAAATGTQVTPAPTAGYTGAWVVTTANGQTTITSGNIAQYAGAPFLTEKLKDKISQAFADARYALKGAVANTISRRVITTTGTYTPTTGLLYADIEVVGAGGGGGGSGSGGGAAAGGGGGGGGYARGIFSAATIGSSQVITINPPGTGGNGNNPGANGGTASFGALLSATGGFGGFGCPSISQGTVAGAPGGVGTGGDFQGAGGCGANGIVTSPTDNISGAGGDTLYGGGGQTQANANGGNGQGYGGGGSGAGSKGGVNFTGGTGAPAIVIITEYIAA